MKVFIKNIIKMCVYIVAVMLALFFGAFLIGFLGQFIINVLPL